MVCCLDDGREEGLRVRGMVFCQVIGDVGVGCGIWMLGEVKMWGVDRKIGVIMAEDWFRRINNYKDS